MNLLIKLSIALSLFIGFAQVSYGQWVNLGVRSSTVNGQSQNIKHFDEDRYMFRSRHGPIMTFHKGANQASSKVHVGENQLTFSTARYRMYVEDGIMSESLKIDNPQDWADFVFDDDYQLPELEDVAQYIRQEKHLPDVPSEVELKDKGYYDQHEINKILLQKIEELTLYVIDQQKQIEKLTERNK